MSDSISKDKCCHYCGFEDDGSQYESQGTYDNDIDEGVCEDCQRNLDEEECNKGYK